MGEAQTHTETSCRVYQISQNYALKARTLEGPAAAAITSPTGSAQTPSGRRHQGPQRWPQDALACADSSLQRLCFSSHLQRQLQAQHSELGPLWDIQEQKAWLAPSMVTTESRSSCVMVDGAPRPTGSHGAAHQAAGVHQACHTGGRKSQ